MGLKEETLLNTVLARKEKLGRNLALRCPNYYVAYRGPQYLWPEPPLLTLALDERASG